jgi:hypothetical protein
VAAAKKPVGWMQSPEARKDRADPMVAGQRKDQAKRLRALPKAAQRAIRLERMNYGGTGANRMSAMRDIAEGRVVLMGNVGKRKNKRSPGEAQAIAQQMNRSATRLKAGMATGSRGRMKYNPRAVEASGKGTAARKIRGARVGGVARKARGRATAAKATRPPSPPDTAQANIPMRGARGRQLDASISRAVKGVQAAQRARLMKPKEQVRAEAATRKAAKEAAAAAKPKRAPRSAESLRLSRAKQVEKRRSITTNPAGNRADAAGRMAASAARTQQRALAFYGGKAPKRVYSTAVNPSSYTQQEYEAKLAKARKKSAKRNGASRPDGGADARARRSARLSGVSSRIAGRARRVYAQQGERVGAGTLPNRGLFAAPMGRRSTGTNAATSGLQPGKKARGARPTGTIAKPRGMKPGALKASRIARGRAKRAAEPLGTRLNRVYRRTKAIEARNDPRTLNGKNTRRNDRSFRIARNAASFLSKGDKAWKDRARLGTGKRSGATSGLQPGKKIRGDRLSGTITKPGKSNAGSAGGKQLTQKEKWAKRAELRRQQAAKAEARAKALYDKHRRQGDTAFWTQPGLHSQREKARAGLARSFAETEKAKRLLENARQLDKLAAANKGDTERRRQTQRDALSVNKGDQVYTAMYGTGRVVKINKKTITYYSESRGTTFSVDKSWVKPGADPYNR